MKIRILLAMLCAFTLSVSALAQDNMIPAPPPGQSTPGMGAGPGGGRGMGMMGMGRSVVGAVTIVMPDHFTIKTEAGDAYSIHFSPNTGFYRQGIGMRGSMGAMPNASLANGQGRGEGNGPGGRPGGPPQLLKSSDVKIGDMIAAMGDVDDSAKSVGAMVIVIVDPERAKQMHELQASFGKTWIMGKVTAIDGVTVTLLGSVDNASHTFLATTDTTFRRRRNPITLADIHVGDMVRAQGFLKDSTFSATMVNVMPQGETPSVPRSNQPQQPPPAP